MQAVRIHHSTSAGAEPFSPTNPAPATALHHDDHVPVPQPDAPGQFLVRIHATTVTRDELTWPETYGPEFPILGHDLSGVIVTAHHNPGPGGPGGPGTLKPGAEVYAMAKLSPGSTWAQFAVCESRELAVKPEALSWAEAASVALSGLTAWQALFEKAGVPEPDFSELSASGSATGKTLTAGGRRLLVTGASGAVGMYLVQIAALVGFHVVASSGSSSRNGDFLRSLGAAEVIEYGELSQQKHASFDLVVDTVGGEAQTQCWPLVADRGTFITVESSSFEFGQKQRPLGKENVKSLFFIVQPSGKQLTQLSRALELGLVRPFVAETFPLAEARAAYEKASGRVERRGKVVLTM